VLRNGVLIADSSGTSGVVPGSGEFWDDATYSSCFFAFDGNSKGQFVLAGVTSAPSDINGVVVFDDGHGNRQVVLREGDPVDLDGNGVFDDSRYFYTFGNDDILLTDAGEIVFTAILKDSPTATAGYSAGMFRLKPCGWAQYGMAASPVNTMLLDGGGSTSSGATFQFQVSSVPGAVALTFVSADSASLPLFGGVALVNPFSLLLNLTALASGGTASSALTIPLDPAFVGISFYAQTAGDDLAQPLGLALSNGLRVTICP